MMLLFYFLILFQDSHAQKQVTVEQIQKRIQIAEGKTSKNQKDFLDLAKNYFLLKDFPKALENARKANQPTSKEALDLIAKISSERKDYLEEVRALELIKVMGKNPPAILVRLALAYENIKKPAETIKNFRSVISEFPKYEKGYSEFYQYYLRQKNNYEARQLLIDIMNKFGEKPNWLNERCRMDIEEKYFEGAKDYCQKAISVSPKVADNHVHLALAFKYTEAEDQARRILFSAAKQFPNSFITQREAGLLSQKIKNYELSQQHFSACIKANPQEGLCHLELGKSLFHLSKYDEALSSFMKSCKYLKESELEIRKHAYDADKIGQTKVYKNYLSKTKECQSTWFNEAKKTRNE